MTLARSSMIEKESPGIREVAGRAIEVSFNYSSLVFGKVLALFHLSIQTGVN